MRIIQIGALLGVLFLAAPSRAQIADLESLRAQHQAVAASVRDLAVDWTTRHVLPRGALDSTMKFMRDQSIGESQAANIGTTPAGDTDINTSGSLRINGNKIYYSTTTDGINGQTGATIRAGATQIHAFDGVSWRYLYKRGESYSGRVSRGGDEFTGPNELYREAPVREIMQMYQRLFDDESCDYQALSTPDGIRLVETPRGAHPYIYTVYEFTHASPFPTEIKNYVAPDEIGSRTIINYDPDRPGVPVSMDINSEIKQGAFTLARRVEITRFALNAGLSDEEMTVAFPAGTVTGSDPGSEITLKSREEVDSWIAATLTRMDR